ncbi:MAG: peptidase S14 [Ruminococcaceae bacterium]|nr:peptidase S14 [Oscillospiraceae bacterium]
MKNENESEKPQSTQQEQILSLGSTLTDGAGRGIRAVTVIGQIEGHSLLPESQKSTKYEHLIPLLVQAEENEAISGVLIILNTVGGDVEAGLALSELIAGMKTPTVSLVLGGGHSIGVPLAVSAKRSFIVPSATMTLHPVRTSGLVLGAPQSFHYFERIQERIIRFVTEHSGMSAERMRELLFRTEEIATDMGSILDGEEAVREGLIDEVGGLRKALDCLHSMI